MTMESIKVSKAGNWPGFLFTALLAVMPLIYSSKGIDPNLLPRQIAISVFIIGASALLLVRSRKAEPLSIAPLFPLLFIALVLCYWWSVTYAVNSIEAKYTALKISVYASAFFVTGFLLRAGIINLRHVTAGICMSLAIAVALVLRDMILMKKLGIKLLESDNVYKINATFGHKNLLSSYLLFTLPFLLLQGRFSQQKVVKALLVLLGVVAFGLIILLQTRAVLLALIVAGGFLACLLASTYRGKQKKWIAILVLSGVIAFASGLYVFRDKLSVISRTESFRERAALWQNSWQMFKEHPLGVGAGNWQIWLPKYGIQKFYDFNYLVSEGLTTFQRPHNDFLWVLCETGIVGGVIYLSLFAVLLWYCIKKQRSDVASETRFIYLVLAAWIVAYAVVALVDFPLERMEHSFLFVITAAIIVSEVGVARSFCPVPKWALLVPAAIGLYSIYVSSERWKSEGHLSKMYRAHMQHDWQQLATQAVKAESDYMNMDYFSLPVIWYAGVAAFSSGDLATAKKYFTAAYEINPYQVHVLNNLGVCYEKEKDYAKALPLLEEAHRISPTFSDGISTLAGAYYNVGRYNDAWRVMSTFKYDDNNFQFKLFATAIIKAKLAELVEQAPDEKEKARIEKLAGDDALLMNAYREAQQQGIPFFKYLLGR